MAPKGAQAREPSRSRETSRTRERSQSRGNKDKGREKDNPTGKGKGDLPPQPTTGTSPSGVVGEICRKFHQSGVCPRGKDCPYWHPKRCYYWCMQGNCRYGNKCSFRHHSDDKNRQFSNLNDPKRIERERGRSPGKKPKGRRKGKGRSGSGRSGSANSAQGGAERPRSQGSNNSNKAAAKPKGKPKKQPKKKASIDPQAGVAFLGTAGLGPQGNVVTLPEFNRTRRLRFFTPCVAELESDETPHTKYPRESFPLSPFLCSTNIPEDASKLALHRARDIFMDAYEPEHPPPETTEACSDCSDCSFFRITPRTFFRSTESGYLPRDGIT